MGDEWRLGYKGEKLPALCSFHSLSQHHSMSYLRVSHLFYPHHCQQRQKSSDIPSQEVGNLKSFLQMEKLRLQPLYQHQLNTALVYSRASIAPAIILGSLL